MKTTVLKSMLLVGLMSVSTVMMGSTKTDNHHEVMNNGHKTEMVMHTSHCQHEMKHGKCLDIHCKCQCHKQNKNTKHDDKKQGTQPQNGTRQNQQNGVNHGQTNNGRR